MQKNIYSREWLDKLIYNNNIVSVISKYLPLQKKNNKFWACCPFHHEKTPSFVVNELEGYYHCFGCGESGNVITFIEKIEGLDFVESVKLLAENANMEIPTVLADENLIQRKKQRDLLVQICTDTAKFYHNQLISENGKSALNYLIKRGVTKQTMVKMGLGYSPNWTSLVSHLKSKNYSYEEMKEAGVVGEKDGRYYDLMAERVMFPVIDHSNRVVGFSGRSLDPNAQAKYKNTPQTSLFKKSEIIYGLNTLRKARLEKDKNFAIIVEGQMDVVSLHQAGFTNAIATMGTAFNSRHVQTLKRFVDRVIVCFDGDNAGKKATISSLEPLTEEGFEISVITIPNDLDPDDYIKQYGAESFKKLMDNALPVYEFEIRQLATVYDLTDKKDLSMYIKNSLDHISKMKNPVDREIYIKMLSEISNTSIDFLNRELNQHLNKDLKTKEPESQTDTNTTIDGAELLVISCLLHKKDFAKPLENDIFVNNFCNSLHNFMKSNSNYTISDVLTQFNSDETPELKETINFDFSIHSQLEQEYRDSLVKIWDNKLQSEKKDVVKQLSETKVEQEKMALFKKLKDIDYKIQLIKKGEI